MLVLMLIAVLTLAGCSTPERVDLGFRPADSTLERVADKLERGEPLDERDVAVLRGIETNGHRCMELAERGRLYGEACAQAHAEEFKMVIEHRDAIRAALASSEDTASR